MNGKGSARRKSEDNEQFRQNFPLKDAFEPQWKKDLRKIKEENRNEDCQ